MVEAQETYTFTSSFPLGMTGRVKSSLVASIMSRETPAPSQRS